MQQKSTIFSIVECLLIYVRVDKTEVKKYYCVLRETHMYLID